MTAHPNPTLYTSPLVSSGSATWPTPRQDKIDHFSNKT